MKLPAAQDPYTDNRPTKSTIKRGTQNCVTLFYQTSVFKRKSTWGEWCGKKLNHKAMIKLLVPCQFSYPWVVGCFFPLATRQSDWQLWHLSGCLPVTHTLQFTRPLKVHNCHFKERFIPVNVLKDPFGLCRGWSLGPTCGLTSNSYQPDHNGKIKRQWTILTHTDSLCLIIFLVYCLKWINVNMNTILYFLIPISIFRAIIIHNKAKWNQDTIFLRITYIKFGSLFLFAIQFFFPN